MGKTYDGISQRLAEFLERQPVFFVATAPLDPAGHVNCSPKGNDGTLVVLGQRSVAYQDLTGSGIETVAHLHENGRMVLMFCAFDGPPRIVRLHGRGRVLTGGDPGHAELAGRFPARSGVRAVVRLDVERVSDSCGYGVPLMDYRGARRNLDRWAEQKGPEGLRAYRAEKNRTSLDGLAGLGRTD